MRKYKIATILICLFLYLFLLDNSPELACSDQSAYILLAQSLSNNQAYNEIWSIGSPQHSRFPPLFPILLAPIIHFFGYNYCLMRLLILIMAIGSLCLIYHFILRRSDEYTALIVLLMTGLSPWIMSFTYHILTEIPFLLFSVLALVFIEKLAVQEKWLGTTTILSILFLLASFFTRSAGAALIPASVCYLFLERDKNFKLSVSIKKIVFLCLCISIPILLWFLRAHSLTGMGSEGYATLFLSTPDPFSVNNTFTWWQVLTHNIYSFIFYAFPNLLLGTMFSGRNAIAPVITAIILYGFFNCLIRSRSLIEYYTISYMLMLLCFSSTAIAGTRYLIPLIPFIFYYFILGLKTLVNALPVKGHVKHFLFAACLLPVFISNIWSDILYIEDKMFFDKKGKINVDGFINASIWAKEHTPPNSRFGISSFANAPVYMHFGRKAITVNSDNERELFDTVCDKSVEYTLVYQKKKKKSNNNLWRIILNNPDMFKEVYRGDDCVIYQVNRDRCFRSESKEKRR